MSFTAPEDTFLDVNDANLRVYGNVHADGLKLGQLEIVTATSTGSTIQFLHQHTGFTTTSNIEVGTTNHNLFVNTVDSRVGILTNTPTATLDVVGDINFSGNLTHQGSAYGGGGGGGGVSSPWTIETSPVALSYTAGNVGVGAATPSAKLEVTGNAHVSTDLSVGGSLTINTISAAATHSLAAVTALGPSTGETLQLTNVTTGLVTTSNIDVGGRINMGGHIIPTTNEAYDIGSASFKIRDLYLSDNSLWIGDEAKISFTGNQLKFRRRKKSVVPSGLTTLGAAHSKDVETVKSEALALSDGVSTVADMKLHHWMAYAKSLDTTKTTSDIYTDSIDNYEASAASEAFKEVGDDIYSAHNVSIGKNTTPTSALDVNGTVTATAFVGDGSALTGISSSSSPIAFSTYWSPDIGDGSTTGTYTPTQTYYNYGNGFDTSNGRFTAPINGVYHIDWNSYTNNGSPTTNSKIILYKNNTALITRGPTMFRHGQNLSATLYLAANEYIHIGGGGATNPSYPLYYYSNTGRMAHYSGYLVSAT